MACACKASKHIDLIYKQYGPKNGYQNKHTLMRVKFKNLLKNIGIWIILIPLMPIMILYTLYVAFFKKEKMINVTKIFRIKKSI